MGEKMKREMSQGLKDRLKRNKGIYEITLNELEQKKNIGELSYPESVETNMQFKINYRNSIRQMKDSLKRIRKILKLSPAKDSGLIRKRKKLLDEHLINLRKVRERKDASQRNNGKERKG